MKLLYRLQYKYGRHAPRGIMNVIIAGMALVFAVDLIFSSRFAAVGGQWAGGLSGMLAFSSEAILRGQVWRLISFVFIPARTSPLWIFFSLYFYWLVGSALEREWGSFIFDVYYLLGVLGTVAAGFITGYATNAYLNLSLFFAFATLFPDFQLMLFFFIPIKIKWIAIADALLFLVSAVTGSWATRASLLASLLNLLIFFGPSYWNGLRDLSRRLKNKNAYRRSASRGRRDSERNSRNYWQNR